MDSRALAPRQRGGFYTRISHDFPHFARTNQQSLEDALGKSRAQQDIFDQQRRLRHIRGVLQQPHVSGHQRGTDKTKNLPERIVPGHHCQNRAEGKIAHETFAARNVGDLVGEEFFRVLGVVAADPGAFGRFIDRRAIGLAHLDGHHAAEFFFVRFQYFGGFHHFCGAVGEGRLAKFSEDAHRAL